MKYVWFFVFYVVLTVVFAWVIGRYIARNRDELDQQREELSEATAAFGVALKETLPYKALVWFAGRLARL